MALSLHQIITLLTKSADPSAHTVTVNGQPGGSCTRASFRVVWSMSGVEFVVDYGRQSGGATTMYSSRVRGQGLGSGGHEQILVNGQHVSDDDVQIGMDSSAGPALYVEFLFRDATGNQRVKFSAPLTAFK
ncbi:hypothetical protein QPK87_06945 [Kamptonema cortianum]|nr:hypothetical protein [Geitlerinema splendidum]MDK3156310.1 hypothetical protein [Kamptonema cortianum]